MPTTGLTAAEAQAALPGQNINKVCRVYISDKGAANVLYDLPTEAPEPKEPEAPPAVPKKAKRVKKTGIEAD